MAAADDDLGRLGFLSSDVLIARLKSRAARSGDDFYNRLAEHIRRLVTQKAAQ